MYKNILNSQLSVSLSIALFIYSPLFLFCDRPQNLFMYENMRKPSPIQAPSQVPFLSVEGQEMLNKKFHI